MVTCIGDPGCADANCRCTATLAWHRSVQSQEEVDQNASDRRVVHSEVNKVAPLAVQAKDWTTYRGNNARTDLALQEIPNGVLQAWSVDVCRGLLPTAPVTAGGLVFVADRSGAVKAFDNKGNEVWSAYTGGPIYYPPAIAHDRVYVGSADGRVYAYAAMDGTLLWTYRVGPSDRWIPVYERLISSWPVSGGVVVRDGTVYAAAGITHYDGTHVVALDAITGELKASNSESGSLEKSVNNGISMQGNLSIVDNELRFLAGGVYETARYDLESLKCLNTPKDQVSSQYRTAFYPYYPTYGKYVSLDFTCTDGCTLEHDASYEGSKFTNLARNPALPEGAVKMTKEVARWNLRRGQNAPKPIWRDLTNRRFTSFIASDDNLLATGHPDNEPNKAFLASIDTTDGSDQWIESLPADVVKGGMAMDHASRIYLTLETGQLVCFEPRAE